MSAALLPKAVTAACAIATLMPAAAFGHHSRAPYDLTREIVVEGTVTKLDWRNPHIFVTVAATGTGDGTALQEIEVASVSEARALGLSRDAIAPGAHVIVRAHPGRGAPGSRAVGLDVKTTDGTVYPLNTDARLALGPAVTPEARGLAGRWVPKLESFNGFFPATQSWPLTEAGRAAQAQSRSSSGPGTAGLGICEPFPPPLLSIFPDLRTIEIGATSVAMKFEAQGMNLERIVYLDQTRHPADVATSMTGHSIGRWDGATLVIDTVAIAAHPVGLFVAGPTSPNTHLVERLTLAADRRHLEYTFTLEDIQYLANPVSYTAIWDYRPDLEPSAEACDPENARHALTE